MLTAAQQTADGRARIALAAALHNIPVWNAPYTDPARAATDWDAQQASQYQAVIGLLKFPAFVWRQEAESRAGGNMSWNTGVDYHAMLGRSPVLKEVKELYAKAGLSLKSDLDTLDKAPRTRADASAVDWMSRTSSFTGRLTKPQLDIHTTGDALIPVQSESAYRRAATAAGSAPLLRQATSTTRATAPSAPASRSPPCTPWRTGSRPATGQAATRRPQLTCHRSRSGFTGPLSPLLPRQLPPPVRPGTPFRRPPDIVPGGHGSEVSDSSEARVALPYTPDSS